MAPMYETAERSTIGFVTTKAGPRAAWAIDGQAYRVVDSRGHRIERRLPQSVLDTYTVVGPQTLGFEYDAAHAAALVENAERSGVTVVEPTHGHVVRLTANELRALYRYLAASLNDPAGADAAGLTVREQLDLEAAQTRIDAAHRRLPVLADV